MKPLLNSAPNDPGLFPGWLTTSIPGTGGIIRATADDFLVQEIPAYGPTGEGQHTLFEIRKRGLSTFEAIDRLARAWQVPTSCLGSAGLKDKHALTQQHLSVEGVAPEVVQATDIEGIEVLWAAQHRNRLKIGHLRGNRFRIRLRETAEGSLAIAEQVLAQLAREGVPNGFGPQRFGARWTSHRLGHALLTDNADAFVSALLGQPQASDPEQMQQARDLVDQGELEAALELWQPHNSPEYRCLALLVQGQTAEMVMRRTPKSLRRLYLSAYQSYLFNQLVAHRLPQLGRLLEGDLAIKHINGAFFVVVDAEVEQARADALEISPSGALMGRKVRLAKGEAGRLEEALMLEHGVTPAMWQACGSVGGRRPLRVPVEQVSATLDDEGLVIAFALPSGAYATNVIGEITKNAVLNAPEEMLP